MGSQAQTLQCGPLVIPIAMTRDGALEVAAAWA
jgi:hypothetical protein